MIDGDRILWRPQDLYRKGFEEGLEEVRAERREKARQERESILERLFAIGLSDYLEFPGVF